MKLEDLKKEHEKNKNKENEIEQIRKVAIDTVYRLKEIGIRIGSLEEPKWKELRAKCMSEAECFFRDGEFNVERNDNIIIAKHDDIELQLKDDSADEMLVFPIKIMPMKIYSAIQIRPSATDQNMLYQKNNLKLNGEHIDFDNYSDLIDKCNEKEKLITFIDKVQENIIHYENTISKFNEIKYIYSIYRTEIECSSFKEVFEKHVNL